MAERLGVDHQQLQQFLTSFKALRSHLVPAARCLARSWPTPATPNWPRCTPGKVAGRAGQDSPRRPLARWNAVRPGDPMRITDRRSARFCKPTSVRSGSTSPGPTTPSMANSQRPQSRILVTSTRGRDPRPPHGPTYTSPSRHRPSSRSMPRARPANGVRGCGARSSPATTGRSCCRYVSWKPPYRSPTSPTRALSTANCGNYPSSSAGPSPCSPSSQRLWRCPGSPEPPTAFTCCRQNWLPNSVTANSPGPPRTAPDASA